MNYFDIIIIIILVWAFYSGFKKGIIYMVMSLIAIIAGLYASIHFSDLTLDHLGQWLDKDPDQLLILAYILTFIIVFGLLYITGKILDKFLDILALGFFNKLAGGIVSVGIKLIVLSLLVWIFDQGNKIYPIIPENNLNNSRFYQPLKNLSPVILINLDKLKATARNAQENFKFKPSASDKTKDSLP